MAADHYQLPPLHLTLAPDPINDLPAGTTIRDGRGDEEEGGDTEIPLARLMGWGNCVQLLRLLRGAGTPG